MSVRHIRNSEDWYVITADRDKELVDRPRWLHRGVWLHGPNLMAHAEWSILGKHGFGYGFEFGRNGGESDVGLSVYVGRLASLWLRLDSPWTKWARVGRGDHERAKEKDPKGWYNARHTGIVVMPSRMRWLHAQWDNREHGHGKREWTLTSYKILGRTKSEVIEGDAGVANIPLPEGIYVGTWQQKRYVSRYVRWPGTWLDRIRGPKQHALYDLSIDGGIPVEGKGENSYDCGMDGLFGCSGNTVEDAIGNAVRSVLRDRQRYGGPHNLPRPMTVREAENA